ncbi:unnamed protein product [Orchesella dallaii]|uniref:Uncharacterized protein n=1 Tax=Orchesella dallaii TaxID=48710 RepID=A0ABP1QZ21_9HEXA
MEEPEIIKMLKYILLATSLVSSVQCHPLFTEQLSVAPVPFHHSGEQYSEVIPSLISASANGHKTTSPDGSAPPIAENVGRMRMTPVSDIMDVPDDLDDKNSGGLKHVRQVTRNLPGAPPPSDELGSLCSIFQFFLEPRRYSRCRVSNAENGRNEGIPSRVGIDSDDGFAFNSNYHRSVSNEVESSDQSSRGSDSFHSESENREIESDAQRQIFTSGMELSGNRREQSASKRYDLEELHIHDGDHQHDSDDGNHHHHHLNPPPPMFPKSSLDRTTIIVPDRPCPRGERRDRRDHCRRVVRVRPSYQYGPPPTYGHGPPRSYRPYYYSRFVSVPTLQFFIPSGP